MDLRSLGWDERHDADWVAWAGKPDMQPGRVAIEFNQIFRVLGEGGEIEVVTAGRLKHQAASRSALPAVGDWVVIRKRPSEDRGAIVSLLPRRSAFSRKVAGAITGEQVVAANVDVAFIVMALDDDYSVRRLERYLLLARESGASPVVLLTKPDLAGDCSTRLAQVVALVGDIPVHIVSPKFGQGLDQVASHLAPGRTAALLGSSGVGKSTIINRLVGEDVQRTREVRAADSKGRHTTMHRELVVLPAGGLIIDTPGMRELQLWDVGDAVRETFEDVETLAAACRFTDCRHREEPGCAVKAAVGDGQLDQGRRESYLKLQDELARLAQQQDERAEIEEKRRGRVLGKALKQHLKAKRG